MEAQEILERVEQSTALSPEKYKQLTAMTRSQRRAFAITHTLKNEAHHLMLLRSVSESKTIVSLKSFQIHVHKLLQGSMRLVQLLDGESQIQVKVVDKIFPADWEPAGRARGVGLYVIMAGPVMGEHLRNLERMLMSLLNHSRSLDEGDYSDLSSLANMASDFFIVSLEVAFALGYTRSDFETWLEHESRERVGTF